MMVTPSSLALPQLLAEGVVADAAFVDGSHRFHEVFVDLYFLRKIVRPGGLIVIDDDWWPSVHTAAQYYEKTWDGRSSPTPSPARPPTSDRKTITKPDARPTACPTQPSSRPSSTSARSEPGPSLGRFTCEQ